MQYTKPRQDLMFTLNPILLVIGLLGFCFYPAAMPLIFRLFWITTLCAAWLIFTPFGNKRLAYNEEDIALKLPWQQWFFCIALLEIALLLVYLGITAVSNTLLPINTQSHHALFSTTLRTLLMQYGLFPWPLYAVIAAGLGMLAYRDETNAYFSNVLKSFTKQEPTGVVSLIVNVGMRRCVLFSMSTLLLFFTLLFVSLVLPLHIHVAQGFRPAALLTTLVLLFISFSDMCLPYVLRLFSRHIGTHFSFPIFCIALGFITLLLSVMCMGLWPQETAPNMPNLIMEWINYDWSTAWLLLSIIFWMCLTPLVSVFIARISKGYRVRSVIIGVLLLPVVFTLFLLFQNPLSTAFEFTPMTSTLISLLGFFVLMPMLVNHKHLSDAMFAYLPKEGVHKMRDHHPFFISVVRLTIVSLYLYLVIGVNGLSALLFVPNFFGVVLLTMVSLAIAKHLQNRARSKWHETS